MIRFPLLPCAGLLLTALAIAATPPGSQPLATFSISEEFGVSHPLQVIDFDFHGSVDPRRAYMIGPEGNQVPFQQLADGKIAVQTDLPAGAKRSWQLFSGMPPRPVAREVRVATTPGMIEVVNGLTGVRVARVDAAHGSLAPIQGVMLAGGVWSATGPNYLTLPVQSMRPPALQARAAETRLIESGPLRARIEVDYKYDRPAFVYANRLLIPAGEGFFRSVITLEAGSPSILIEDDTDMDLQYVLDFYREIRPDRGRYRAHHATKPEFGHGPDGAVYDTYDNRPPMDAEREFGYHAPTWSAYITGNYNGYSLLQRLGLWNPWIFDSGWYWTMYNQGAPPDSPLIGIFPGPASRLIAAGDSGPGFMFLPGEPESKRVAAICFQTNRRGPAGDVGPHVRVPWAIFTGTKAKDLADPLAVQTIMKQFDLHSAINLNKVYRYQLTYPDPPGGVEPLYMSRDRLLKIVNRVRTSQEFSKHFYDVEPGSRPLLEMWRDPKGDKVNAQAMHILDLARSWLDSEVNGNGLHDPRFAYWHGGLVANTAAPLINEMLALEPIPPAMRDRLKAVTALFGYLLWDEDLVPLSGKAGVNLGNANMPVQQYQYRHLYAVMLARNPAMKEHAADAAGEIAHSLETEINSFGAQRGSPHYADASMEPLLDGAQQIRNAGLANLFESEPVIAKFARFYMQFLTPPEPRFGAGRKMVSIGDGSTESSPMYGELGTYFAGVDAALSRDLMGAWRESGSAQSNFHGTTVLKIDEDLPASAPKLDSSTWPGWFSVLRGAFGTAYESALWFVNGDFYSDHRHEDQGSIVLYALGAPISIDWGSTYNPHVSAPYMHSSLLPESAIGAAWTAEPTLESSATTWIHSTQDAFSAFDDAAFAAGSFEAANGSKWFRTVTLVHPDDRQPMIVITDALAGPYAAAPRVATLNLMARDAVVTPAGPVTPPLRLFETGKGRKELPSGGTPAVLAAGMNRFHFLGQFGVDWDLYTLSPVPQQFVIGSWGHAWHPSGEMAEFQRTNRQPFHEQQYILRVRGTGPLKTLIVPAKPGTTPPTITRTGDRIEYRTGPTSEGEIGDTFQAWRTASQTTLTAFDRASASAYGLSISGGPAEATLKYNHAFLTITGPKGRREFHLGGNWETKSPAQQLRPGIVVVDFDGTGTLHLTLAPAADTNR